MRASTALISFVVVLSCCISGSYGTAYYVNSKSGSDSQDGKSEANAWATLSKVQDFIWSSDNFQPGDTLNLARGSSWSQTTALSMECSGTSAKRIVIQPYGDASAAMPLIKTPNPDGDYQAGIVLAGDYLTITGIHISDVRWDGIVVDHHRVHAIVSNCLSDNVDFCGISLYGGNSTIENSEVTDCGLGICMEGSFNLIKNNSLHDLRMAVNTNDGGEDDYGAVGINVFSSWNEISYNTMARCVAPSYDFGVDGGVIEFYGNVSHNYIHHNWGEYCDGWVEIGAATSADVCSDNTFAYNVGIMNGDIAMIHNGGTFGLKETSGLLYEHNTFYEAHKGSYLYSLISWDEDHASNVLTFRDNIAVVGDYWYFLDNSRDWTIGHDHNLFQLLNSSTELGFSLGTGDAQVTDVKFVDPPSSDFHLQDSSPAVDTASTPSEYTQDFDGNPVPCNDIPDKGAYEYCESTTSTKESSQHKSSLIQSSSASCVCALGLPFSLLFVLILCL
ncbi:Hemolysin-type calcium-binding region [Pelomyxa schiedti]|nr:Hemolysin-type calcium-binding region [Pelomyxa schiedti]